jgi:hypothetical protein
MRRATSIQAIKRQFGCSLEEAETILNSFTGDGKLIEARITLGGQLGRIGFAERVSIKHYLSTLSYLRSPTC